MEIRTGLVADSNCSYIIARKEELSQQLKDAIVDFAAKKMLGEKIASDEEELGRFLREDGGYMDEGMKESMYESVRKGMSIFWGWVSFEGGEEIAYLLQGLWKAMEEADASSFAGIDTELIY